MYTPRATRTWVAGLVRADPLLQLRRQRHSEASDKKNVLFSLAFARPPTDARQITQVSKRFLLSVLLVLLGLIWAS